MVLHNGIKPFNILLVMPDARIHKLRLGVLDISFREAPLTATTLAALVPDDVPANVTIVDESVQPVPFETGFDLVGISCLTGTAPRGYAIADRLRKNGSTVVLGGVHVTLMPDEAAAHADAIVTGYAEQSWPRLLRDFAAGKLQREYRDESSSLEGLPAPRRDLQKRFAYMVPNTVFATRGCKGNCEFCTVAALQGGFHTRPVADVIDEVRQIRSRRIVFNDVHITEDRAYAKELLTALIPLKKKWGGLASARILYDDELLELLGKSGCSYLLIGLESFSGAALSSINKGFNRVDDYRELVRRLHALGIVVQGCFILGFEDDDEDVFARTVDMVNDLRIDIPRYAVFTPYPKTGAFARLEAEGRILHRRWELYDTQHVVFQPARMSPQRLEEGFKWTYRKSFSLASDIKRTWASGRNLPITFLGNLAYKLYIRRLHTETGRLPVTASVAAAEAV